MKQIFKVSIFVLVMLYAAWALTFAAIANNKITEANDISSNAQYLSKLSSLNLKLSSSYYLIDKEKCLYYKQKSDSLWSQSRVNSNLAIEALSNAERLLEIGSLGVY